MTYLRKCGYRSFGANFVHSVPPFKLNYSLCKLVPFFLNESQESFDRQESRDLICILRHAQYNKFAKSVSLKKFQVNVVQALENRAPPYYLGAKGKSHALLSRLYFKQNCTNQKYCLNLLHSSIDNYCLLQNQNFKRLITFKTLLVRAKQKAKACTDHRSKLITYII